MRSALTMLGITMGVSAVICSAAVLSLLGGGMGLLAGISGSAAVSDTLRWPTLIPP